MQAGSLRSPDKIASRVMFGLSIAYQFLKTAKGSCDIATANLNCEFSTRTLRSLKTSRKLDMPASRTT